MFVYRYNAGVNFTEVVIYYLDYYQFGKINPLKSLYIKLLFISRHCLIIKKDMLIDCYIIKLILDVICVCFIQKEKL